MWNAYTIRALRLTLGLSHERFARRLGCTKRTVCYWESGQVPPAGTARALLTLVAAQVPDWETIRASLPEPPPYQPKPRPAPASGGFSTGDLLEEFEAILRGMG